MTVRPPETRARSIMRSPTWAFTKENRFGCIIPEIRQARIIARSGVKSASVPILEARGIQLTSLF